MVEPLWEHAAAMLRVMGHPQRLLIAQCLEQGEMRVGEIALAIGCAQSATSQHLKAMREAGLLRSRRQGNRVFYAIRRPELQRILSCIHILEEERQ